MTRTPSRHRAIPGILAAVSLAFGAGLFGLTPLRAQTAAGLSTQAAGASSTANAAMGVGTSVGAAPQGGGTGLNLQSSPAAMLEAARSAGQASGALQGVPPNGLALPVPRGDQQASGAVAAAAPSLRTDLPPLGMTGFQRLVGQTVGRTVPLFGYNLFEGTRFTSLTDVPVPADYVLGPGDEIDLKIWGSIDLTLRLQVDRQGQVMIPRVGLVTVAGTKADTLDTVMRRHVSRTLSSFELSATVGRTRSIQVFVVGQARKPGTYLVSSVSTLLGALFETGGPAATGSMRQIQLVRRGAVVSTIDIYDFLLNGKVEADMRLLAGDVIVIPPAGPRVALVGALDGNGVFELKGPSVPLNELLRLNGTRGLPQKVIVERAVANPADGPSRRVELPVTGAAVADYPVLDGDIVSVLPPNPNFSNAVTLRGNVALPLRYAHKPGMRISDVIPEPDALIDRSYYARKNMLVQPTGETSAQTKAQDPVVGVKNTLSEVNWSYASIERLNRSDLRIELVPFNLRAAVVDRDPTQNLELQSGDVITVYSVETIPVPASQRTRYVRVSGEVARPGVYEVALGDNLNTVLSKAGGLTPQAYPYGSVFTRESVRQQQQQNLEQTIRRLQSESASSAQTLLQGRAGESIDRAALLESQRRSEAMMIERLQTLKASGRIALDLNPQKPVLPALQLEDGDTLLVPQRPSFVSIFGAVLAESSFVHREGLTVGDLLQRAGLGRDADLNHVLVIRADGSVEGSPTGSMASLLRSGVSGFTLFPGDTVFVPEKLDKRSPTDRFWQNAKDFTQLLYQLGLGAAAIKTLRN